MFRSKRDFNKNEYHHVKSALFLYTLSNYAMLFSLRLISLMMDQILFCNMHAKESCSTT